MAAKIIARIEAAERANAGALAQLTRLQSVPDSELASAGLQAAAPKTAEKGAHFDYSRRGRCPASLPIAYSEIADRVASKNFAAARLVLAGQIEQLRTRFALIGR